MTTSCPNGHDSEWPDWCSICGERLAAVAVGEDAGSSASAAASPATPAAAAQPTPLVGTSPASTGPTCENCGVSRHEHDVFCESCGYDFASGSLPEGTEAPEAAAVETAPMHAKVSIDADFFAASVGDADLALPDPLPETQIVPLPGIRILIGRTSTSRGVFPEIDVQSLTSDPAVSSRHAMLERSTSGEWTLTDLGSTNGTFFTSDAADAIEAGLALPIAAGKTIFLGAWTKIHLVATTE